MLKQLLATSAVIIVVADGMAYAGPVLAPPPVAVGGGYQIKINQATPGVPRLLPRPPGAGGQNPIRRPLPPASPGSPNVSNPNAPGYSLPGRPSAPSSNPTLPRRPGNPTAGGGGGATSSGGAGQPTAGAPPRPRPSNPRPNGGGGAVSSGGAGTAPQALQSPSWSNPTRRQTPGRQWNANQRRGIENALNNGSVRYTENGNFRTTGSGQLLRVNPNGSFQRVPGNFRPNLTPRENGLRQALARPGRNIKLTFGRTGVLRLRDIRSPESEYWVDNTGRLQFKPNPTVPVRRPPSPRPAQGANNSADADNGVNNVDNGQNRNGGNAGQVPTVNLRPRNTYDQPDDPL